MRKFLVIAMTIAMLACSVVGVSAFEAEADKDGFVTIGDVVIDGTTLEGEYGFVVVEGLDNKVIDFDTANILYIDQVTAANNKLTFAEFGLKEAKDATAFVGGKNLSSATAVGTITIADEPAVVPVTGVTLDAATKTLKVGESATLVATVTPDNATDKTVAWTSSEASVASVSNGVVTALTAGTTTITATAGNYSATCIVTVEADSTDEPGDDRVPGDANDSNSVTMRDANVVATAVVAQDFSSINESNADVNGSNSVTMRDANLIATAVVAQDFSSLK